MSDEGSQAAESLVDLFRLLLRPHSEISSSSAKDHLQGKIIGSLTALQAALNGTSDYSISNKNAYYGMCVVFNIYLLDLSSGQRYVNTVLIIRCNVCKIEGLISLYRHAEQKFVAAVSVYYKSELYALLIKPQYAYLDHELSHLLNFL